MAEAIVSLAIEKIAHFLISKTNFLSGVRVQITLLQDELERMQCFLKDADSKQNQDERVSNWIAEVREVAYDAEDVLDTFIVKALNSGREGILGLIENCTSIGTKAYNYHKIGDQIQSILTRIERISKSTQTYGIKFVKVQEGSSSNSGFTRRSYPHEEAEHIISFDQITEALKAKLIADEEKLGVVSIAGMGGLGKTTLARKAYNDKHVRQYFDCRAWLSISQQFSTVDVLAQILVDVGCGKDKSEMKKSDEEDLVRKLFQFLKEGRFLVVLDDIWSKEAWNWLKPAFSNGKEGSKVLFTTRNREVATYATDATPVELPLLTDEQCWQLLSKKAFSKSIITEPGFSPLEFEKLGMEMVKLLCSEVY